MSIQSLSVRIRCGILVTVVGLSMFLGCGKSTMQGSDSETQYVHHTGEELLVDGILNESCWTDVETWTLKNAVDDVSLKLPTTVRAIFDDTRLLIGIECQDTDAASTVTERDAPVFSEEHVTVYLDAGSNRTTYAMIEIAPTGAVRDAFVVSTPDGSREQVLQEWNCEGLRTSVNVYGGGPAPNTEDRFWTIEIAIPFEDLYTALHIPPDDGDVWLWNISRVDYTNTRELSILSPTGSERFHVPSAFSGLIFNRQ